MHRFRRQLVITAVAATALFPPPCVAAARPSPQRQLRPVVVPQSAAWHAARPGTHTFYGTIVAIRGSLVTVRLRSGSYVTADDAIAVAHGDYSAPLFVGKNVSVDGESHGATFRAAHLYRVDKLSQLPNDR
jgi:hypothetical protein